jgi:hypothetical protein
MSVVKKYIEVLNKMNNNFNDSNSFYNGIYDFLIKEGILFKSVALTKSEQKAVDKLFSRFIKMNGVPKHKECYYNAQIALYYDSENIFRYSEGFAIDNKIGIPLSHGFLTINGKVVDLTWRDEDGKFYIGDTAGEYFGVRFDSKDIRAAIKDTEMAHSHIECYWNNGLLFKNKFNDSQPYYLAKDIK